jgi:hypothetical protein
MIDDRDNPYTTDPDKQFDWLRSRVLGGRPLHWARASDRMSDFEFRAAARDGYGQNWPISCGDVAHDRVEPFMGVSGAVATLPPFPDGVFQPPSVLNSFCPTHGIGNLSVFSGGCFVTTGDKHPTLAMMALTARGCDPVIDLARKKEL